MGIFFLFLLGITAMLILAKLASKLQPKDEGLNEKRKIPMAIEEADGDLQEEVQKNKLEALIALLISKAIISEKELLGEISRIKNRKE